jgi:hypothetical protein
MKNLIKKILKEEKDKDWDFMNDITNPYEGVRTSNDYMEVWDELAYEFQESCVPLTKGYVISNDYDGEIDIEIYTPVSESQPRGGRIRIFMEVTNITDEMEWDMEWSFDMFSNTSYESEEVVRSEQGQFYSGGMRTILQPVRDEIKKLKPYFCEESN